MDIASNIPDLTGVPLAGIAAAQAADDDTSFSSGI
jgi:hypothetical protein